MGTFLENKVFSKLKIFKNIFLLKVGLQVQFSSKKKSLERFDQLSTLKNDFENQNFKTFVEVVHNIGKSDGDII